MKQFIKGETTQDKTIEWFCTSCGQPIEERYDLKVEGFCCSNKDCINNKTVLLMPMAIYSGLVDCRNI